MKLVAEAIKGTQDALPKESYKWQYVESVVKDVAKQFDFKEIRTPIFEASELKEAELKTYFQKLAHKENLVFDSGVFEALLLWFFLYVIYLDGIK